MKVLITAGTSAKAFKIKGSLIGKDILLGDYNEIPAFTNIIKLPNPAGDTFAHEMLTLSLDNSVESIYLLDDREWQVLQISKQLFSEYNIELINGSKL